MSEVVKARIEEGAVGVLTVHRPEKLNALNSEVLDALEARVCEWERDDGVRALLITGAGEKAFVAGADIAELSELDPRGAEAASRRGQRLFDRLASFPKPVVAAIGGYALGGGLELALACHLRVASKKAKLGLPEIKLGILPGYGGTQRLPRLVGLGRALEIMLTGEPIDAEEAHRIGLVNRVVEPEALADEALGLARALAGQAPLAVRAILEAATRGVDLTLEAGERLEAALFGLMASTHDTKEGLKAFLEKRTPKFEGR